MFKQFRILPALVMIITSLLVSTSEYEDKGNCDAGSPCCSSGNNSGDGCQMNSNLILVQVIFRHGDRTPIFSYPRDPHLKSNSSIPRLFRRKGMLTKRGKVQAYELGLFLGDRYMEYLTGIKIPEDVYVLSSEVERAMMTAETCLAGLFPPECADENEPSECQSRWSSEIKWQPIPVYVIPKKDDNKIDFQLENCPGYMDELDKVLNCARFRNFEKQHKNIFEIVKANTGWEIVGWKELGRLYDTLFIQELYGLELPEWTKSIYPEPLKEIEELTFQVLSANRKMMRLNGGPLLKDVMRNMRKAARKQMPKCPKSKRERTKFPLKRLYMFSGHDTTVSAFLSTLNVFDFHQPPYTAAVMIELHHMKEEMFEGETERTEESTHHFIVKVFYRNRTDEPPHEMIIPECGDPCHLDKLEVTVRDLLLSKSGWQDECRESLFSLFLAFPKYLLSLLATLLGNFFSLFEGKKECGSCK